MAIQESVKVESVQELSLAAWMQEEQHGDWVEMMQDSAVIPFATALWA